jgi:hypothetical protein
MLTALVLLTATALASDGGIRPASPNYLSGWAGGLVNQASDGGIRPLSHGGVRPS